MVAIPAAIQALGIEIIPYRNPVWRIGPGRHRRHFPRSAHCCSLENHTNAASSLLKVSSESGPAYL